MSSVAYKRKLSGSTDGKAIKVTQTATPGDTIHTADASAATGAFDEVWIWAMNYYTSDIVLSIEFGGTTTPDNIIKQTIPYQKGLFLVVPGLILQNSGIVKAFAATANYICLSGFVNRMTDS